MAASKFFPLERIAQEKKTKDILPLLKPDKLKLLEIKRKRKMQKQNDENSLRSVSGKEH